LGFLFIIREDENAQAKQYIREAFFLVLMVCSVVIGAHNVQAKESLQPHPSIHINEVRIDAPGADELYEYVEIAGAGYASLDSLTYLVIGDFTFLGSGEIELVNNLSGQSLEADGFFVIAHSAFTLGLPDMLLTNPFESYDNVTHLLVHNFTGSLGDDLDTDDDGILDVLPWDSIVDLIAIIKEENPPTSTEYHYGPPTVGPDGSLVPYHVFYCSDGWVIGEQDPALGGDTPSAENNCPVKVYLPLIAR
jgi:hypothetical protein